MKTHITSGGLLLALLLGCTSSPPPTTQPMHKETPPKKRAVKKSPAEAAARVTPLPPKRPATVAELQQHLRTMMAAFTKGEGTYMRIAPLLNKYVAPSDHPIHYERRGWITARLVEQAKTPVALMFTFKAMYLQKKEVAPKNHAAFTKTRNFMALIAPAQGKKPPRIVIRETDHSFENHNLRTTIERWDAQTVLLKVITSTTYSDACCGSEDEGADKDADYYGLFLIHGGDLYKLDSYYPTQEMQGKWGALTLSTEYRVLRVPGEPLPLIYFENRNRFDKRRGVRRNKDMDPPCQRETKLYRVIFTDATSKKPVKALSPKEIKALAKKLPMLKKFPHKISTFRDPKNRCKPFN